MLEKKIPKKPSTELYVNGKFTEDREEWKKELQRPSDQVYKDLEETREVQEERKISISKEKETDSLRRTGEELKSQLTWSCKPDHKCRKTRSPGQKML